MLARSPEPDTFRRRTVGELKTENDLDHVELPRARVGGLKREPVEKLLGRISQDFARLQVENDRLSAANERLSTSNERLWASLEALDSREYARGAEDNPAGALLVAAQKAARELRETTRSDCELALKKTRSYALSLQLELERDRAELQAEIEDLRKIRRGVDESMRASLLALRRLLLTDAPEGPVRLGGHAGQRSQGSPGSRGAAGSPR